MPRLIAIGFVILLLGGIAFYFWPRSAPAVPVATITNYPSKGTDIVAFGDSLVAGYGSSDNQGFVSILSKDIGRPIVNLGEDGDTTAEALARISQLNAYKPKVVIVLVGGNDYLQKKDMTQAFVNLGNIITNIQSRGAVVVLVGVRVSPYIGNFDNQFNALVAKYHTAYVPDVMDGVFGSSTLMSDSIHPNEAGYQILAKRILPVLKSVLQ